MSAWGQGSTRATRKARDDVLDRDAYVCHIRHPGCTGEATEAHHIYGLQGRRRSEAIDIREMVAACSWCHSIETKRQTREARAAARQLNSRARRAARPHPGD